VETSVKVTSGAVRIDLHSHSRHSDGVLTPEALARRAHGQGVTTLALTDHDTVSGVREARATAPEGLEIVAGLEITTELHGREIHLLGHFVDVDAPALVRFCAEARGERATRIERMVAKLQQAGIKIDLAHVLEEADGATLARPHLARTLLRYGYVESLQQAFDRYLCAGMPGYVGRAQPTMEEAIAIVRAAGGTTSIAHPGVNKISRQELTHLATLGLDAVEANHPDHPPSQADAYARWAAERGMTITGGSDFHADGPDSHGPPGSFLTPPEAFERLRSLAGSRARAGS
jgi:predicted metal-dependent phosphoesterase TrpH